MIGKLSKTPTCLFMQAAQPVSRYVVVREAANGRPVLTKAGRFEHSDIETLVEHARQELTNQGVSVSRAVLLLPRGDVEVNSLELPPATEDELPELVANMLAQADESGEVITSDFLITGSGRSTEPNESQVDSSNAATAVAEPVPVAESSRDVLTFSVAQESIEAWSKRFKDQGFKLLAITYGGMGAVQLLGQVSTKPARTSIVVTTTDQDTDLAVVENGLPILFRTIPRSTGGEQFVTEQLAGEIGRTLSLVGHPDDEETRVYLIGTMDEQEDAAKLLSDKLSLSVSLVNPFDQLRGEVNVDHPSRFASLIGTATAWNRDSMVVDLLNPRKPKPKPSAWRRFAFWGVVASLLLALGGYLLWEQGADQRAEIEQKQIQFDRLVKRAQKAQTKVKTAEAIDAWRASEISWLDELQYLSEHMPPASEVTIGSLSMSAGGKPGQRGRMDMSVNVTDPSVRLEMEKAIRDARHSPSSKRVTDASNRSTASWRFQTLVTVAPRQIPLESVQPVSSPEEVVIPSVSPQGRVDSPHPPPGRVASLTSGEGEAETTNDSGGIVESAAASPSPRQGLDSPEGRVKHGSGLASKNEKSGIDFEGLAESNVRSDTLLTSPTLTSPAPRRKPVTPEATVKESEANNGQ